MILRLLALARVGEPLILVVSLSIVPISTALHDAFACSPLALQTVNKMASLFTCGRPCGIPTQQEDVP